jgi:hypothetical protein
MLDRPLPSALLVALAAGCAADLRETTATDDGAPDTGGPAETEAVDGSDTAAPETFRTVLDATSEEDWVPLDLDAALRGEDAGGPGWDLQARRYLIALNGGVSGEGGVQVAILDGVGIDEVDAAALDALPSSAWVSDQGDDDDDGLPEYALEDWYDYDSAAHTLSPKLRVYALQSTEGARFVLQVEDYYDEAGTSGHVSLLWGAR